MKLEDLGLESVHLLGELLNLTIFVADKLPEGSLGQNDKVGIIFVDNLWDFKRCILDYLLDTRRGHASNICGLVFRLIRPSETISHGRFDGGLML